MVTSRFQSRTTLQAPVFDTESRCFFVSRKPAFSENERGSITHLPHFRKSLTAKKTGDFHPEKLYNHALSFDCRRWDGVTDDFTIVGYFLLFFQKAPSKTTEKFRVRVRPLKIFLFCLEIFQLSEGQSQNFFVQIEKNFPIG